MSYARALEHHDRLLRLGAIAREMQRTGLHVDQAEVARLLPSAHNKVLKAKRELREVARLSRFPGWQEFNPGSSQQLNQFIFGHLGIEPRKWSPKTGEPSADKDLALRLSTDQLSPKRQVIGRALFRYREAQKEEGTWIRPLRHKKRIHPIGRPEGAKTGRWAYGKPYAMQTWPQHVRSMIVPRPGWMLVAADKSQVELRLMAALASDRLLLEAYAAGKDVHAMNALTLFGRDFAKLPPGSKQRKYLRNLAKRFVYAVNYQADPKTVWRSLVPEFPKLTYLLVLQLCDVWFTVHPEIRNYARRQVEIATEQDGLEIPISGLWVYFYNEPPPITACANLRVQGAAAADINDGIERLSGELDRSREALLLQVHDEVVGECEIEHAPAFARKMKECLDSTVEVDGVKVSLPVDVKMGMNWMGFDAKDNPNGMKELKAA